MVTGSVTAGLLKVLAANQSGEVAPTDIEGRAAVRKFLESYLRYTPTSVATMRNQGGSGCYQLDGVVLVARTSSTTVISLASVSSHSMMCVMPVRAVLFQCTRRMLSPGCQTRMP